MNIEIFWVTLFFCMLILRPVPMPKKPVPACEVAYDCEAFLRRLDRESRRVKASQDSILHILHRLKKKPHVP